MDGKDFLNNIGMSTAAFALVNCTGCKQTDWASSSDTSSPARVNFTLDLSMVGNALLLNKGGSLVSNGIIVANTQVVAYIAVQRSCTHESYVVSYQSGSNRFSCLNHGETFSASGTITNVPASRAITVYNTQLMGTTIKVYS